MKIYNPHKERIHPRYFVYLKEAKWHSEPTIDASKSPQSFESVNKLRDFTEFHSSHAIAFKKQTGASSVGEPL